MLYPVPWKTFTEISPILTRSHQDCRDLPMMFVSFWISVRSQQVSAAKKSLILASLLGHQNFEISQRSRRESKAWWSAIQLDTMKPLLYVMADHNRVTVNSKNMDVHSGGLKNWLVSQSWKDWVATKQFIKQMGPGLRFLPGFNQANTWLHV